MTANSRHLPTDALVDSDDSSLVSMRQLFATSDPIATDAQAIASHYERLLDPCTDYAMYTGVSGAALACYIAGDRRTARRFSKRAVEVARLELSAGRRPRFTLVEGVAGAFLVGIVVAKRDDDRAALRRDLLRVWSDARDRFDCYEVLYGMAGYCAALIVALEFFPADEEIVATVRAVCDAILAASSDTDDGTLMYTWHGKRYIGYAHGLAGICNVLHIAGVRAPALEKTVDRLAALAVGRNGRMPSSGAPGDERLVQWCHGAPGFVALFLNTARDAALPLVLDDVWHRGLLRKGVGMCHGVSGHGLLFLAHYRATQDRRSLARACLFAHAALTMPELREGTLGGDDPYSLFNGFGARVLFLVELRAALGGDESPVPRSLLRVLGFDRHHQ